MANTIASMGAEDSRSCLSLTSYLFDREVYCQAYEMTCAKYYELFDKAFDKYM